jgi:hypothetical protein
VIAGYRYVDDGDFALKPFGSYRLANFQICNRTLLTTSQDCMVPFYRPKWDERHGRRFGAWNDRKINLVVPPIHAFGVVITILTRR